MFKIQNKIGLRGPEHNLINLNNVSHIQFYAERWNLYMVGKKEPFYVSEEEVLEITELLSIKNE